MPPADQASFGDVALQPDDVELLARLQAGDDRACESFVRSETPKAQATARRMLRSDSEAQDAVQEAFLSFFRSLGSFKGDARLTTWFYRIVVNACLMRRRSQGRRHELNIDELLPTFYPDGHRRDPHPAWQMNVDDLVANEEVRRLVREKIDLLPEDYRNVLLLRDIEEMDTAEAAAVLGDSPGAIKTRLHRARQALRTLLEKEPTFCPAR